MQHLRLVVPIELSHQIATYLSEHDSVANVVRLPGAAEKPRGDVLLCDVAKEDMSVILDELKRHGLHRGGSICIMNVDLALSESATHAEEAAVGAPADAVVWESVEAATADAAELNVGFMVFLTLATMIAAIGIITDSVVLIIGAMVVGPEFGPLAGLCVAAVQRRMQLAWRSLVTLAVGFPFAVFVTWLMVLALRAAAFAPATISPKQTWFISHPDVFSVIVALLAGVAGIWSLSTAKSSALVGVFISVTTVPAAANIAVAAGYHDHDELAGASIQLAVNIAAIIVAGTTTLALQRAFFVRRLRRSRALQRVRRAIERIKRGPK